MLDFFDQLQNIILLSDSEQKCHCVANLQEAFTCGQVELKHSHKVITIKQAGLPDAVQLVAPRALAKRGIAQQKGRNILMHSIAHIEFNAINLALDAAYRFRNQPMDYYRDWLNIAADEARHFQLVEAYLSDNDCAYGDYPAHNGLWDMAARTQDDVVARMALVPRVLEARGLDVTPKMIERLQQMKDHKAVAILQTIYQEEIAHVGAGSHWFHYQCKQHHLDPKPTFIKLLKRHLHGELKGPFNLAARLQAGFDEIEMQQLEQLNLGR